MIKASIAKTIFDYFFLNTDCKMSLVDREYLKKSISNYKSKTKFTDTSIKVREIENAIIIFNEYIVVNLNVLDTIGEKSAIAKIIRSFYIVNNSVAKTLIDINIIDSKRIKISAIKFTIESC